MGLSVAIAASLLIALYVRHELSYEDYFTDPDRLYWVDAELGLPGQPVRARANTPYSTPDLLNADFGDRLVATRVMTKGAVIDIDGARTQQTLYVGDPHLFDVLDFPAVAGDPEAAMSEPGAVVLTESMAKRLFGDSSAIPVRSLLRDVLRIVREGVVSPAVNGDRFSRRPRTAARMGEIVVAFLVDADGIVSNQVFLAPHLRETASPDERLLLCEVGGEIDDRVQFMHGDVERRLVEHMHKRPQGIHVAHAERLNGVVALSVEMGCSLDIGSDVQTSASSAEVLPAGPGGPLRDDNAMNDPLIRWRQRDGQRIPARGVEKDAVRVLGDPAFRPAYLFDGVAHGAPEPPGPRNGRWLVGLPRDGLFTEDDDVRSAHDQQVAKLFPLARAGVVHLITEGIRIRPEIQERLFAQLGEVAFRRGHACPTHYRRAQLLRVIRHAFGLHCRYRPEKSGDVLSRRPQRKARRA